MPPYAGGPGRARRRRDALPVARARALVVRCPQQGPETEQVHPGALDHLEPAGADELLEREIGAKSELPGEPAQEALERVQRQIAVHEVIDDVDLAAGPAHAAHFVDEPLRLRHHRSDVHRHHLVEAVVGSGT